MSLEDDVRWLRDRAEISELLCSFAQALDSQDAQAYADNFTSDGVVEFPQLTVTGPDAIAIHVAKQFNPESMLATHHMSANHQIEINGDQARSRSYFTATHVPAQGGIDAIWTGAGWYENEYQRTPEGWRFSRVRLCPVWRTGAVPAAVGSGRFDDGAP